MIYIREGFFVIERKCEDDSEEFLVKTPQTLSLISFNRFSSRGVLVHVKEFGTFQNLPLYCTNVLIMRFIHVGINGGAGTLR